MRWSGFAAILGFASMSAAAHAQAPAEGVDTASDSGPATTQVGTGAMPGGLHAPAAEVLPPGTVELSLLSGYGYRKGLLGGGHTFNRASGELAVAYAPVKNLLLGVSFDGRYDKHTGVAMTADDDNFVGNPRMLVRGSAPLGGLVVGGQLGIWLPGKNAPSIAVSAISVDARALLSIDAGFGQVALSAGFRVDNSAETLDPATTYSVSDQVSLGVSEFHAALAGAALRIPAGRRAFVQLEGSTDVFVGSGAPSPIFRGGVLAGVAVNSAVSFVGYVELAKVPGIDGMDVSSRDIARVPYEPTVTGGVGLQAHFGGVPRRPPPPPGGEGGGPTPPPPVIEIADIRGLVVDDTGKPVVGASVALKLRAESKSTVTDDKGAYVFDRLPIGKTVNGKTELDDTAAEVAVSVANKKPGSAQLTLVKGANSAPTITLDPILPPGELRAVIRNVATGRPVADADVTIEPGGVTVKSGADGKFTVTLAPGRYKLTVTARGLAQQQLDVKIEENGVAIKNIDMHK